MPSKTEEYLALAQRTANGLTRYWKSWTDYLTTASRLYKYPFADQLMIYAQRPDATACADFDIWNNRMNRYIRRGSKGIALLDESSGFPRLHYVFDVSDTGVRRNSRNSEVWQYNDDLKQPVSEMPAATYGISGERVSQQLADVAGKLVADYWDNNGGDIRAIVDGSLLMDYDHAGVEMQFKSAAAISVTYTLLERCGFEPAGWFDKDDFQAIYNFSTPDAVFALGAAVSDMSREVLRNIERKMIVFPFWLFTAFLALMLKWTLNLSAFVLALPMLYIFGCGLYTLYCREWLQFLILLVAEFGCFLFITAGTVIVEAVEWFSGWIAEL